MERDTARHRARALALTGVIVLTSLGAWQPGPIPAQPNKQPPPPVVNPTKPQAPLPLTEVVLFSSGVGYFQRDGEVLGNSRIDLSFPVGDVNDLLKSLVLQDFGGGQVSTVTYDSQDPTDKALKSFALDLTKNPSFAQLLNQARGEKVEVDWQAPGVQSQALKGTVVGVERQKQQVIKDTVLEVDLLNLYTAEGLRSLPLPQVQRVRFANSFLDTELKRALEVLASSHDTQKRVVSLSFTGEGKRPVRVGYVVENPVWKTSYRMVLDKGSKPFLQGWAIVDNATDEDWGNVRVTLVSGRPISFRMDLYQPLYVPRPLVELELFASLRPPVHGGALDGYGAPGKAEERARRMMDAKEAAYAPQAAGAFAPKAALNLQSGVVTGATAAELGDFFQYALKQPVTLPRQKSAMLPIVNQAVEGTRVSIYNQNVQVKHPLLGLRLKNTTGLHLMQGPITVFEGSSYAGDARVSDLQPKEERLISYAVDLGTEVEPVGKGAPDQLVAVKIARGILYATYKLRETKVYNLKNRSGHDRLVLLEHPFRADWNLVSPGQPVERSRDVYRFPVTVPAGKAASQEVVEEKGRVSEVMLSTTDDQTIRVFLSSNVSSPKVRQVLEKAGELKGKLAETLREIDQVKGQLKGIAEDQARLRANMERVPAGSPPYQRYMKKLDEQETQIEKLQAQILGLQKKEGEQRRAYETYLLSINVE
jgi:hypothetical protein